MIAITEKKQMKIKCFFTQNVSPFYIFCNSHLKQLDKTDRHDMTEREILLTMALKHHKP